MRLSRAVYGGYSALCDSIRFTGIATCRQRVARATQMVIESAPAAWHSDPRVLAAMAKVPRECSCPPTSEQKLMPTGLGDRLRPNDQPAVHRGPDDRGAGADRQTNRCWKSAPAAAIKRPCSPSWRGCTSIERHAEFSAQRARGLKTLGYKNCTLVVGDGTNGWPERAPYDRIIVTAAAHGCRKPVRSINEGGILVIPLGPSEAQSLQAIRKVDGKPVPPTLWLPLRATGGPRGTTLVNTLCLAGWPTASGELQRRKAENGTLHRECRRLSNLARMPLNCTHGSRQL